VTNVLIKGASDTKNLIPEIKRVIYKLPSFKPASHKGYPVNVKHSLPLDLNIN